jgi:hypothetical protein
MTDLIIYNDRYIFFKRKPENLQELQAIIEGMEKWDENYPWYMGDILNFAVDVYGEGVASQLFPERGRKTKMTYMRVAKNIPVDRRKQSSFSVWAEIDMLDPALWDSILDRVTTVSEVRQLKLQMGLIKPRAYRCTDLDWLNQMLEDQIEKDNKI